MKTNYKNATSILIISCLTLLGCGKEWLDLKPDKRLAVPSTLQDFQGMLDNVLTTVLNYPSIGEVAADGHYVTDAVFNNMAKSIFKDGYIWSHTMPHIAEENGGDNWQNPYANILNCNVVLDGLKANIPNDPTTLATWNSIKGQALFIRGFAFFMIAQAYAVPYNGKTAGQDLGIVLRLTSDITIPSKRSSVKESYDQILKDLLMAKDLLPARPNILTRGSRSAVLALLSRVYLSMDDYMNAGLYADESLKLYSRLIDYNTLSTTANFIGRYNDEVLFHSSSSTGSSILTTNYLIEPSLFNLYGVNDLRRKIFFRQNANTTISFKGNYNASATIIFCGLATDEVYLTRAECYARVGKIAEALKDLNDLLKTRWEKTVTYVPVTATDAEDVLRKILVERRKELILRGLRWIDLRRLNKDPRFAITLTRTVAGTTYTLEPDSYKYTFPIPDDIIQQTGMKQNPGW